MKRLVDIVISVLVLSWLFLTDRRERFVDRLYSVAGLLYVCMVIFLAPEWALKNEKGGKYETGSDGEGS